MSRPIELRTRVELDAPAASAWDVVSRYELDPQWRRGVRSMTASPPGTVAVGTTTDEHLRLAGRAYRNLGEVLELRPGRSFSWRTVAGAQARGRRSVEPLGEHRCRVELELTVTPRPAERLLAPIIRHLLARNLAGDGERLAELVSRRGGATSGRDRAATRAVPASPPTPSGSR